MNERIDRFLSENSSYSRSEIKNLIRKGQVLVNGSPVKDPDHKIDIEKDQIMLAGKMIERIGERTYVMNKPAGYVTSTDDPDGPTVMELIPKEIRHYGLFPVGRLDKDTEGLLIFTNDGELSHRLTSPKYDVTKCYYAEHEGAVSEEDVKAFSEGLTLKDGLKCKPARLEALAPEKSLVYVTEGKYHQVRRMMASKDHTVRYLKRLSVGNVQLGELPVGSLRELTESEMLELKKMLKI